MKRVIVIGGGISGFIAAISAKKNDNEVIILERNSSFLKKLLITGNGKCNYFNENFSYEFYNSSTCDLKRLITNDNKEKVLSFFSSIGLIPRIKNEYYYPNSNQAVTVKNNLIIEAEEKGIILKTNVYVDEIKKEKDKFIIKTNQDKFYSDYVIIATGSKAYPKTGSDGNGYTLAKKFGHSIINILPLIVSVDI